MPEDRRMTNTEAKPLSFCCWGQRFRFCRLKNLQNSGPETSSGPNGSSVGSKCEVFDHDSGMRRINLVPELAATRLAIVGAYVRPNRARI